MVPPPRRGHAWYQPLLTGAVTGLLCLSAAADVAEDAPADGPRRRLADVIQTETTYRRLAPEALLRAGTLPELIVGGFRLQEVVVVHEGSLLRQSHVTIPASLHQEQLPPRRRLDQAIPELGHVAGNFRANFRTLRDRVRTMVGINAAALPEHLYNIDSSQPMFPKDVYDNELGLFYQGAGTAEKPDNRTDNTTGNGTFRAGKVGVEFEVRNGDRENELAALKATRDAILKRFAEDRYQKLAPTFVGVRSPACDDRSDEEEICAQDTGISVSVYTNENLKVRILAFSGMYGATHENAFLWYHKEWLTESYRASLWDMWGRNNQPYDPEMAKRTGGDGTTETNEALDREVWKEREKPYRCGFYDSKLPPISGDLEKLAERTGASADELRQFGLWAAVKKAVRKALGPRTDADFVTLFTGSHLGGMFAALASLHLKEKHGPAEPPYETYLFSATGWNCMARRLLASEVFPEQSHAHVSSYFHLLDPYGAIDLPAGRVCYYGQSDSTRTLGQYCARAVGHSGAEVIWNGPPRTELNAMGDKLPSKPSPMVDEARKAIAICSYFAHSPWYALVLLQHDNVLFDDGSTDGGCEVRNPITQQDAHLCPYAKYNEADCDQGVGDAKTIDYKLIAVLDLSVLACIIGVSFALACLVYDVKKNRVAGDLTGYRDPCKRCCAWLCGLCGNLAESSASRAHDARARVKEMRIRKHKKQQRPKFHRAQTHFGEFGGILDLARVESAGGDSQPIGRTSHGTRVSFQDGPDEAGRGADTPGAGASIRPAEGPASYGAVGGSTVLTSPRGTDGFMSGASRASCYDIAVRPLDFPVPVDLGAYDPNSLFISSASRASMYSIEVSPRLVQE